MSSLGVFAGGFLLLIGAVGAVAAGQITTKPVAAWLSMGYAAGAVLCTLAALMIGRRR